MSFVFNRIKVDDTITVDGTTDGRDVSTDGATLDSHIATLNAHGTTGDIVGTSDSQTLTNKIINAANNTITNITNTEIQAAAAIDTTKLADGSISNTEFQYLNGLTSNIQTQLDNKSAVGHTHSTSDIISGTFADARIAVSNITQHEASINHDALTNFVANEHIDHTSVSILAGIGLTGGGNITASRTIDIDIPSLTEDTSPLGSDYLLSYDSSTTTHKKILISNLPSIIEYAESEAISSTTSTSWNLKVSLTFTATATDYLLQWYAEVCSSNKLARVQTRVQEDDTTTHHEADWNPDTRDEVGYGTICGFRKITLTAGSHTFDMDYTTSNNGKSVSIRRARISATRL